MYLRYLVKETADHDIKTSLGQKAVFQTASVMKLEQLIVMLIYWYNETKDIEKPCRKVATKNNEARLSSCPKNQSLPCAEVSLYPRPNIQDTLSTPLLSQSRVV